MSYMVGGSDRAVERCLPLFRTSGPSIMRTGPSGSGIRAKLAHQLIVCINMLAASEGMRLGRAAGLSSAILEQVVHEGGAQSRIADQWSQLSLRSATPVFFKDLPICLKFAHELGTFGSCRRVGPATTRSNSSLILPPRARKLERFRPDYWRVGSLTKSAVGTSSPQLPH